MDRMAVSCFDSCYASLVHCPFMSGIAWTCSMKVITGTRDRYSENDPLKIHYALFIRHDFSLFCLIARLSSPRSALEGKGSRATKAYALPISLVPLDYRKTLPTWGCSSSLSSLSISLSHFFQTWEETREAKGRINYWHTVGRPLCF